MVERWLRRDNGKHHLRPEHKQRCMAHLAAWLWRKGQRSIQADELEPWFHEFLESQPDLRRRYVGISPDKLEEDLRTATFLVRIDTDDSSQFRFAHTSMQEFFLAQYLLNALQQGRREAWAMPVVSAETLVFLGQSLQDIGAPSDILQTLSVWRAPYLAQASELWLRYSLMAHARGLPTPTLAGCDLSGAQLHGFGSGRPWPAA